MRLFVDALERRQLRSVTTPDASFADGGFRELSRFVFPSNAKATPLADGRVVVTDNFAAYFLRGDGRAAYFLPLPGGGDVKLVFSLRYSPGEHLILRVEPAREDGLARVKEAICKSATPK